MAEFKKQSRFSGGANRPYSPGRAGGNRSFGSRAHGARDFNGPKELFSTECAGCHKDCQVPFRPNGVKPVYCNDCFQKDGDRPQRPTSSRPSSAAPARNRDLEDMQRQLAAMNATLEKLLTAIEGMNRSAALTKEVQKHIPAKRTVAKKPAAAPKKAKRTK